MQIRTPIEYNTKETNYWECVGGTCSTMGKETSIFVEAEVNEPYEIVNRYGSIIYTNFEKGA